MNRREFSKFVAIASSIAVTSSVFSSCTDDNTTDNGEYDLIVVGAGIAGLATAYYAKGNKLYTKYISPSNFNNEEIIVKKILILEGNNRIGGRINTDRTLGVPVDLGASWIHGTENNPIYGLAQKSNLQTFATDDNSTVLYDKNGKLVADSFADRQEAIYNQIIKELNDLRYAGKSIDEADNELKKKYSDLDEDAYRYFTSSYAEFDSGGALDEIDAYWWNQDKKFEGADVVLQNGYDSIANEVAKGIEIKLNNIVSKVMHNENGVTIQTNQGIYKSKFAVIAVPLGVLQSKNNNDTKITFEPPIFNQSEIDKYKMGYLNKVALEWDNPFWDINEQFIGMFTEKTGLFNHYLNMKKFSSANILVTFAFGKQGIEIEKMTDQEVIDGVMANLKKIYGEDIPHPKRILRSNWNSNKFSQGAYSFASKGFTPINSPENYFTEDTKRRVALAGEYMKSDYKGTVHGAFLSSLDALSNWNPIN